MFVLMMIYKMRLTFGMFVMLTLNFEMYCITISIMLIKT